MLWLFPKKRFISKTQDSGSHMKPMQILSLYHFLLSIYDL